MPLTRTQVSELLRERGIKPKKSLGQNFLVDANFLDAMVRDAGIGPRDVVIEIGSGLGSLTERLAQRAAHVFAIELDPVIQKLSMRLLGKTGKVSFVNADGAEFDRYLPPQAAEKWKIVSNLPYSSWERLVLRMLSTSLNVESYTLMIQADVYERLQAKPGTKEYGPMPALLQGACEMRKLRRAGKGLFHPTPRVDSVVFQLKRRERVDFEGAFKALKKLFSQRRKKSKAAGGKRVEALPPADLLRLV